MKVLTFNARIWTRDLNRSKKETYWKNRMAKMREMIEEFDPDVICFQELMFPATSYIPKGYKRVGLTVQHPIYVRKSIKTAKHIFKIHLDAITINERVRIINVHSHWNKKINAETNQLIEKEAVKYRMAIACGDFNNFETDISLPSFRHVILRPKDQDTFINFDKPEESHGIIDHFYLKGLREVDARIITEYGRISDHYPVLLTL